MKRILVLDGGGVKGLMQSVVLAEVERVVQRSIWEIFDLIVGTSVGAILGAILARGTVTARYAADIMQVVIPQMFKRRIFPPFPKYSREPFARAWAQLVGEEVLMREVRTRYMCTAVNMCDGRTHFFKSWEPKDGALELLQAVLRSFAAPAYFGALVDEHEKSVWLDGGTGICNCPLQQAIIEALRLRWMGEPLHLLSIGTGMVDHSQPFAEAKKYRTLRQVLYFADPADGGLARNQSIDTMVEAGMALHGAVDNYSIQRIDVPIRGKIDCLDGVQYAQEYLELGRQMAAAVNYAPLRC